ncbi:2-C-methyl-D-erythritol 2,4-cyclodiphosphate synthase [Opitutales bacterium]|jgi:2-C-methyl-D-erythritol 2,4-cyclodiphosphate synthase|nr:2-C-methyl-D-erythritol 2,4-cyclodiphosphate synthase [Opitutales bacterium]
MNQPFRIGQGYDIHRFAEGRKLILGGIEIPHALGLEGHSDADCLTHALADAILGALALPDIGVHFPPSDPALEGIDSMKILLKAKEQCEAKGYLIGNVDATIIAEKPTISPYVDAMKERLAQILDVETNQIGIKATTNEGIGGIGRGEGIGAHAVCLLVSNSK